ncbi:MAG: FG-GAP-like repeat-containing protein [Pirellulaceae bacterium]
MRSRTQQSQLYPGHRHSSLHAVGTLGASALLLFMMGCGSKPSNATVDPAKAGTGKTTTEPGFATDGNKTNVTSKGALPILFAAPEFTLTDQSENTFGTKDLSGRVWIANFIFTHCTATCPMQTDKLAELQREASRWPDWDRVRMVSITVDPERDTTAKLREYAKAHQADEQHWKFLTGKRAEIARISKDGFKLPVSDADATPITHSSKFILVDAKGQIRGFYDGISDQDNAKLRRDLQQLLAEPSEGNTGAVRVGVPADVFNPPWLAQRQEEQLATRGEIGVYNDFNFVDSRAESGIKFVNRVVPDAARNFKKSHYDHGNGVAAADVDGDGLTDLYFVSQVGGNELWRNLGKGRFENITASAGVGLAGRVGVSASFADTDNDGDADLYVTTTRHGNVFFENDGQGRFQNITSAAGLEYSGHSSSADFFDFDRDGKLDLFLTNVGVFTTEVIAYSGDPAKKQDPYWVAREEAFAGHLFPDRIGHSILYRNEGKNKFRNVTEDVGLAAEGWFGDATPLDVNDDGWLDLYVVNMQGNDECFVNLKGERFEAQGPMVFPKSMWGGMSVKSLDYNNDGHMDIYVTNMHADMWELPDDVNATWEKRKTPLQAVPESYLKSKVKAGDLILGNALYSRESGGEFQDVSQSRSAENYWPWGLSAGDLNADGFQDVFIGSCMNYPMRYHVNSVLLNDQGKTFRDAEFILGVEPRRSGQTAAPWFDLDVSGADKDHSLALGRKGKIQVWGALGTRSAVLFDLDQDGDLDIVTNDFHSPPLVLVSNLSERMKTLSYLQVQLRGTTSNRDGLGAKVQVEVGGRVLTQVHDGQSGYLSQSSLPLYFGLKEAQTVDKITVTWPNGKQQIVTGPIKPKQLLVLEEKASETAPERPATP